MTDEKPDWVPDRSKLKDPQGRYLTQGLFLEMQYDDLRYTMYTLKDEDLDHKGTIYPSLRRLYLEMEDPTEYNFANKYLWGWEHWQKICSNSLLYDHIVKWQEELEVRLRAKAIKSMLKMADGNFNAAKWAADGHWNVKRGRPSKEERDRERRIREKAIEETANDASRVVDLVRKPKNG